MRASDSRHNKLEQIYFWLGRQLATYSNQEPPPTRVRLIPVSVLQALDSAYQGGKERQQAIINLAWIALFFLLRLGKYCRGGANTAHHYPLLQDIQFFIRQQPFNAALASASPATRAREYFVSLLFTTQKMVSRGDLSAMAEKATPKAIR